MTASSRPASELRPINLPRWALVASLGLVSTSCESLQHEPWAYFPAGARTAGVSAGWPFFGADFRVTGKDGGLLEGYSGDGDIDYDTNYAVGAKADYFLTANHVIGARIDWREFEPETVDLNGFTFEADEFVSMSFVLSGRYLFPAIGAESRWRPFLGGELSYQEAEVDFQVDSETTDPESVRFDGSGFYNLGATTGLMTLLSDETLLEIGVLRQWPMTASEESVSFGDPLDPSGADFELEPSGFMVYFAVSVAF